GLGNVVSPADRDSHPTETAHVAECVHRSDTYPRWVDQAEELRQQVSMSVATRNALTVELDTGAAGQLSQVIAEPMKHFPIKRPRPGEGDDHRRTVGAAASAAGPLQVVGFSWRHVAEQYPAEAANIDT